MIFYSGQSTLENKKNNTYFEEKEQNFKINVENSKKKLAGDFSGRNAHTILVYPLNFKPNFMYSTVGKKWKNQ